MSFIFRSLFLTVIVLLFTLNPAIAKDNSRVYAAIEFNHQTLVLDKKTVDSATLHYPINDEGVYGVNLKLNTNSAGKLNKMTQSGRGKKIKVILNGKVLISSTVKGNLGTEFLVSGMTQEEAETFINSLGLTY